MIIQFNKKSTIEFEKNICFEKPELWFNEACKLFASAQILYEFSQIQNKQLNNQENQLSKLFSTDLASIPYFNYRIIRMLWGYGFENLLKGLIVMDVKLKNPEVLEVPKRVIGHDLLYFFKKAGISLDNDQKFYIKITKICSTWMGRYPLPIDVNNMYTHRESYTPEDQKKVIKSRHKRWLNGERLESELDILQNEITTQEYDTITLLIKNTKAKFKEQLSPTQ